MTTPDPRMNLAGMKIIAGRKFWGRERTVSATLLRRVWLGSCVALRTGLTRERAARPERWPHSRLTKSNFLENKGVSNSRMIR